MLIPQPIDIPVYVIGDAPFRSETLNAVKGRPDVIHIPSVRLGAAEFEVCANQGLATLLYGRPLTVGEVGCVLAHRRAYLTAQRSHHDWVLVLEDDAEFVEEFFANIRLLPLGGLSKGPSIVSLYSHEHVPRFRWLSQHDHLRERWAPPSTTTAYLINRRARSLALMAPEEAVSSADWPPWAMRVKFYALVRDAGVKAVGASTMPNRPSQMSMSRSLRVRHLLSGYTYRKARKHFSRRRQLFHWYLVSPMRRLLRGKQ